MLEKDTIIQYFKQGLSNKDISTILKKAPSFIAPFREQVNLPSCNIINKLLLNPEFKNEFSNVYLKCKNLQEVIDYVQNHKLFTKNKISFSRISELRNFYQLPNKSNQEKYISDEDRIRGYIIRNIKYSAGRRNLEFNLSYKDIELPEYCPILNIKLNYNKDRFGDALFNTYNHASVDRIDNNKGYIKGNIIVISRLANAMKNQASFNQIETFSKNMIKLINHYKNQGALGSITDVFPEINLKI